MRAGAPRTFYGWRIVAGCFLTLLVSVGIGIYAPPVFLVPLQEHFGWSRAAIAAGGSIAAVVSGIASPLIGAWLDRYGARRVMIFGALVMGSASIGDSLFMNRGAEFNDVDLRSASVGSQLDFSFLRILVVAGVAIARQQLIGPGGHHKSL